MDAGTRDSGLIGQQAGRLLPACWRVAAVTQAGQREELIGQAVGLRHFVRNPPVVLDDFQVPLQPGPRGEAVVTGDYQLGAGQSHRIAAAGMVGGDEVQGARYARPGQVPDVLGLLAELLQAGIVGERDGWHWDSFRRLRSASQAERRHHCHAVRTAQSRVGSALSADRRRPARHQEG